MNLDEPRNDQARAMLEARRERLRSRLLGAVTLLDRRRREALDVRAHFLRNPERFVKIGAGLLLGVAAAIVLKQVSKRIEKRRLPHERREALRRLWSHPTRVARSKARPSLVSELFRAAVKAIVMAAIITPIQAKVTEAVVHRNKARA